MRKFIGISLATLLLGLAVGLWVLFFANYSEGFRVGQVIKLSHKGMVFKTWEGTLDQGYLAPNSDTGIATRIWDFSVDGGDTDVRQAIDAAIAGNQRVKLYYREKYFNWSFRGDTKYFVYRLENVALTGGAPPAPAPAPQPLPAPNGGPMPGSAAVSAPAPDQPPPSDKQAAPAKQ